MSNRPDYKNWVPKSMIVGFAAGTAAAGTAFALSGKMLLNTSDIARTITQIVLSAGTIGLLVGTVWMTALHRAFDYDGKWKMAKQIIDGIAEYVNLPDGGIGLDVGCGSGALTIACAKKNRNAQMVGCDIWSGAYKAVFTKERCENNAAAEGVENVSFEEGNAVKLPFADESFDVVTSNYVYHNITGKDKQMLLLETLRVLKKGGIFVIHDLMSKARYGNMDAFISRLKTMGYENVRLIDTTDDSFMSHIEAALLGLGGSTLLVGRK